MHKVVLKAQEAVCVKCSSCKQSLDIQANPRNHPVTMAFTHPRQAIKTKCAHCAKELLWSPEDLMVRALRFEAAPAMA